MVNAAERIVCWNAGAQKLLGYTEDEVLNKPCYQVMAGRVCGRSWCHAGCEVQRAVERGVRIQTFDMQVTTKPGTEMALGISVFAFEMSGERFTIHLLRDMTHAENTKAVLSNIYDTLRTAGIENGIPRASAGTQIRLIPVPPPSVAHLTRREIEVLQLLAEGLATKDLAKRLGVSPFTIRRHIESVLMKTGLHTQAQAVSFAYRAGLL